jgi:surface antigen/peptidoglycan hydrolase CwlO-like protein
MKTKTKQFGVVLASGILVAGALLSPYSVFTSGNAKAATIGELQAQANALQAQVNDNNAKANALGAEADTLKGKIAEFDLQIQNADTQIQLITVKLQQLDEELKKAQLELDRQKSLLKASLQTLYKKGGASPVELIVGSDSFSQYINDQTYLERLKSGIQTSAEKVIALKQQIQTQQDEQKKLLTQQQEIRKNLEVSKAERQALLDATQGEEARYRSIASDLKEKQLAINREIISRSQVLVGSDGGYPYKNAQPWDSGFYSCPSFDPWGMCMRSCTSFTAWRVASTGRRMPGNFPVSAGGNATDWPRSARMNGISTGSEARQGAVAVWHGYYGHVAYVEEIMDGGKLRVSEYNYVRDGAYDERLITPGYSTMPDEYIYF